MSTRRGEHDVIVVGARCAGAPTAMLMARKGYRVLLVDRARFPSDIPHGHLIHRHGPRRLQRWGLLEKVVATGCPAVTEMTLDLGDFPLRGEGLSIDGVALGYGPRRGALDALLVQAAADSGAEVREEFTVEELIYDTGRVAGIRGRSRSGESSGDDRATVIVGADGRNSRIARLVGAPTRDATSPLTCWYFSYWSGVAADGLEVYLRGRSVIFAFPTNDGLYAVFVAWGAEALPQVRSAIEREFMAVLARVPALADRVAAGRREERFAGATDLPNYYRTPYGPGWALVGDAACHKDPYLALGICDAFRDAELLAGALDDGLSGRRPMEEALALYASRMRQESAVDFDRNLQSARFTPPPREVLDLRAAVRGNQAETNRFFMAVEGMVQSGARREGARSNERSTDLTTSV